MSVPRVFPAGRGPPIYTLIKIMYKDSVRTS